MATIVDALLVTLSLDATGIKDGAQSASAAYDKMVLDAKKASVEFQNQMDADAAAFKRKQKAEAEAYKESQETVKASAKERAKGLSNFKNEQSVEAETFKKMQREKALAFKNSQDLQIKKSKEGQVEQKKTEEGISGVTNKVLGLLVAFAGVEALKNFTEKLVDANTHVKRTSGILGIAAEQLNAWQMAAQKSGASGDDIEGAFRSVNQFQEDIAKGNPAAIAKLNEFAQTIVGLNSILPGNKKITFDVQRLTDKTLPAEERMLEISKVLSQLSEKDAALAAGKLGISEDVARFLRQGADQVQKSVDAAKELDSDFQKAADHSLILSKQWVDIKQNIKAASDGLFETFYPAIKAVGDIFNGILEDINSIHKGKFENFEKPENIQYDAMGNPTGVTIDSDEGESPSSGENKSPSSGENKSPSIPKTDAEIKEMKAKNDAIMHGEQIGTFDQSATKNPSINKPITNGLSQAFEVVKAAKDAENKYGIPAAITLAQYQLESGSGKHMPTESNNPFGIKAAKGQPFVEAMTTEHVDGKDVQMMQKFAKFDSISDAFDAHAKLLANHPAYKDARSHEDDPEKFADALTGKYATDPNYGSKIKNLIAPGSAIDKSLMMGAGASSSASPVNNNQSSNATHVETHIGNVNVNAPNAKTNGDVANEIGKSMASYAFASNANLALA